MPILSLSLVALSCSFFFENIIVQFGCQKIRFKYGMLVLLNKTQVQLLAKMNPS